MTIITCSDVVRDGYKSQVHGKIREGILKLIALERKGDMVDRGRLRGLVRMLVELGLYAPLEQVILQRRCKSKVN